MANTAVFVSAARHRLTYILTGDGTIVGPTITNATILGNMLPGPLKNAWNRTYANQAAMRTALLGGGQQCIMEVQVVVDSGTTDEKISVDVDTDAVSVTKAEINIAMSDTTGQIAYLHIIHRHSAIQ